MKKTSLILAILCFAVAIVVFVLADDARKWYSSAFFAVLGLVMLTNAFRGKRKAN